MKTCGRCKTHKTLDAFSKNRCNKDGLQSRCKACDKETRDERNHNSVWRGLAKDYLLDYKTDDENLNDASIRFFCEVLGVDEWVRLTDKYTRLGSNGCLLWEGTKHPTGYGHLNVRLPVGSNSVKAHRVAYALEHGYENLPSSKRGPDADTLVVDHICETRNCVNADHLQVVTSAENLAYKVSRAA